MNPTYSLQFRRHGNWTRCALAVLLAAMVSFARAEPWTFAVMGDTRGPDDAPGVNTQIVSKIAMDIASQACRFVLVSGDLIWGKTGHLQAQYAAWSNAMAAVYQARIPIYPVRGNHELYQDPTGAVWRTIFPNLPTNGPVGEIGLTYSFVFSNAFYVALDEYARPHRVNQPWLDAQLKANTQPHIFVYGHEPAFRVVRADCLASNAAERDAFWESLRRAGGRVYFCGHDHLYNRAAVIEGARPPLFQIVACAGGAPLHAWKGKYYDPRVQCQYSSTSLPGYTLVTVEARAVTVEWKALLPDNRWKVLDALTIVKPIRATRAP